MGRPKDSHTSVWLSFGPLKLLPAFYLEDGGQRRRALVEVRPAGDGRVASKGDGVGQDAPGQTSGGGRTRGRPPTAGRSLHPDAELEAGSAASLFFSESRLDLDRSRLESH